MHVSSDIAVSQLDAGKRFQPVLVFVPASQIFWSDRAAPSIE
jgi:hypothetical protein